MTDNAADSSLKQIQNWKCPDILFAIASLPSTSAEPFATDSGEEVAVPAARTRLFFGSSDFTVFEFERSGEEARRLEFSADRHTSYVTGLARCGDQLVSGSYDGRLIWWDIARRKAVRGVTAHDRWIRRVIATPDGQQVISIADDMHCRVWDVATGELRFTLSDHQPVTPHNYPSMLYAVGVSDDGQWLATADKVGHVAVWNLADGTKVATIDAPEFYTWDPKQRVHSIGGIRSVAFSPCGERLALGGIGQIGNIDHLGGPARMEIHRWQSGEHLLTREDDKRKGLVEQMAWHPAKPWLLCAGGDDKGFITVWNIESGEIVQQEGSDGHIHGFVLEPDWSSIYTAGHRRIEHWQLPNTRPG